MSEGAFRKLDVDQYDLDRVLPSELYDPDPRGPAEVLRITKGKAVDCRSFLQRYVVTFRQIRRGKLMGLLLCVLCDSGDVGGALRLVLEQAPYGEEVEEAKVGHFPHFERFRQGR